MARSTAFPLRAFSARFGLAPSFASLFAASVLWAFWGAASAGADDMQVNTYTTDSQVRPRIATDATGGFVAVWQSYGSPGSDSTANSVQARRFADDGSAIGDQFQVNSLSGTYEYYPEVAADADGDFVVVWESYGSTGDDTDYAIQGQRYASDGTPRGGQFQVNTETSAYQYYPQVAMDADGDFVVVWMSDGSSGTDSSGYSIQAQRFASDGSLRGGQFQVNDETTGDQRLAAVSLDSDGDFVIAWQSASSSGTDSDNLSIQAQRYASDGSPRGGQFQVNIQTTGRQASPDVAIGPDGAFVLAWESESSAGSDQDALSVQGRRYASDGTAIGDDFQVNTYTTDGQYGAAVALDPDGNFVIVWQNGVGGERLSGPLPDDADASIRAQRYEADGTVFGDELQINTYTTGDQFDAAVALDADGEFVVVWRSYGSPGDDSDGTSIQRSAAANVPVELMSFKIE